MPRIKIIPPWRGAYPEPASQNRECARRHRQGYAEGAWAPIPAPKVGTAPAVGSFTRQMGRHPYRGDREKLEALVKAAQSVGHIAVNAWGGLTIKG